MKNRNKFLKFLLFAPIGLAGIVLFTFIVGEIVRRLWNWLLPELFGLPIITFWQAVGLLVLTRILVGGFSGRGRHDGGIGARVSDRIADRISDRVADRVAERLEGLSPEERERFTQRLRERWGTAPTSNENSGP
jgi:hypothetical protein